MSGLIHERTAEQIAVDAEVLAHVKAGIAFLEEHVGPGWVEDFGELSDFNIRWPESCVLGKVYGNYHDALGAFGISEETASEYGFNLWDGEINWPPLQEAWERELTALGVGR